jgi:CheY-like chemotaxis protein
MSAARLLHFGEDECNRLAVLQKAGYEVATCQSGPELVRRVEDGNLDAVLFGHDPGSLPLEQVRLAAAIPFVLFGTLVERAQAETYDLIVEPITSPHEWLERLSEIIERSRAIREQSALLRCEARTIRSEAESTRQESEAVRRESEKAWQMLQETRKKLPEMES